jgi:DNA repair protein RadC
MRLLAAGPDALADHEMLEIVLFSLPRRDTKPLARCSPGSAVLLG